MQPFSCQHREQHISKRNYEVFEEQLWVGFYIWYWPGPNSQCRLNWFLFCSVSRLFCAWLAKKLLFYIAPWAFLQRCKTVKSDSVHNWQYALLKKRELVSLYCTVHKKSVCDIGGEHEIPQYLLVSKIVQILFPQFEGFSILNFFNGV